MYSSALGNCSSIAASAGDNRGLIQRIAAGLMPTASLAEPDLPEAMDTVLDGEDTAEIFVRKARRLRPRQHAAGRAAAAAQVTIHSLPAILPLPSPFWLQLFIECCLPLSDLSNA